MLTSASHYSCGHGVPVPYSQTEKAQGGLLSLPHYMSKGGCQFTPCLPLPLLCYLEQDRIWAICQISSLKKKKKQNITTKPKIKFSRWPVVRILILLILDFHWLQGWWNWRWENHSWLPYLPYFVSSTKAAHPPKSSCVSLTAFSFVSTHSYKKHGGRFSHHTGDASWDKNLS